MKTLYIATLSLILSTQAFAQYSAGMPAKTAAKKAAAKKAPVKQITEGRVENLYYPYRFSFRYSIAKELIKFARMGSCASFKPMADSYYRLNKVRRVFKTPAEKAKFIKKSYSFIDRNHKEYEQFKKTVKKEMATVSKLGLDYDEDYYRSLVLMSKLMSPRWKLRKLNDLSKYDMFRLELDLNLLENDKYPTLKNVLLAKESLLLLKLSNVVKVFGNKLFNDFERFFSERETDVKKMFASANKECQRTVTEINNVMMLTTRLYREELTMANKKKKIKFTHQDTIKHACKYQKELPLVCKGFKDFMKYQKTRSHKMGKPSQKINWAQVDWDNLLQKFDPGCS